MTDDVYKLIHHANKVLELVEQLMPGIKNIALQDYSLLNEPARLKDAIRKVEEAK